MSDKPLRGDLFEGLGSSVSEHEDKIKWCSVNTKIIQLASTLHTIEDIHLVSLSPVPMSSILRRKYASMENDSLVQVTFATKAVIFDFGGETIVEKDFLENIDDFIDN